VEMRHGVTPLLQYAAAGTVLRHGNPIVTTLLCNDRRRKGLIRGPSLRRINHVSRVGFASANTNQLVVEFHSLDR
jgi:hypothetical protein